jgi:PmbA protein
MPTVQEIASFAETSAKKLGIQKYDVYGSNVDETSVQVDRGDPKQVKASNRCSVIVRVWNQDGKVGVTSTSDVDPTGIDLALETAQEASTFLGSRNISPTSAPKPPNLRQMCRWKKSLQSPWAI